MAGKFGEVFSVAICANHQNLILIAILLRYAYAIGIVVAKFKTRQYILESDSLNFNNARQNFQLYGTLINTTLFHRRGETETIQTVFV